MNWGNRKYCTCSELISELAQDPYYGVQFIRADTGEPYVEDPSSSELFLTQKKPEKYPEDKTQSTQNRVYDPALVTIYQADSERIEFILKQIYTAEPKRRVFRDAFGRLPCKGNQLLLLIFSWCGPLGLHYSRKGQSPENQESDLLKNWSKEFQIQLEDMKEFLRKNSWPLPVNIFENEPDNTQKKVNLSNKAYEKLVRKRLVLIPQLKQQLKEVSAIPAESMSAHEKKQQEVTKLNQQIEILMRPSTIHSNSMTPMTKRERGKLATQERYLDWGRQAAIIQEKYPEMAKTEVAKRIFRKQEKKKYAWRYIYKNMTLEKK